jgi:hypothetical protein
MRKQLVVASLAACLTAGNVGAAEFTGKRFGNNTYLVTVRGDIEAGDYKEFAQLVQRMPARTLVALNSDGGQLAEGLISDY